MDHLLGLQMWTEGKKRTVRLRNLAENNPFPPLEMLLLTSPVETTTSFSAAFPLPRKRKKVFSCFTTEIYFDTK